MNKILFIFFFGFIACLSQNISAQSTDEIAVRTLLEKQENAWNQGNIEAFMDGYWKSDSLMFVGKSGITYGWQKTLDNYKKHYPDVAAMGKLHFDILEMKAILPGHFFIIGKWQLTRSMGNIGGYFSLLFKKINRQWLIVCDHTS